MNEEQSSQDSAPARMTKAEAIALLGGTQCEAAARIGISAQAVQGWPAVLTDKLRDRVQAVLWREHVEQMLLQQRRLRRAALLQAPVSVEHAHG